MRCYEQVRDAHGSVSKRGRKDGQNVVGKWHGRFAFQYQVILTVPISKRVYRNFLFFLENF